ncbi:phospholipase [Bifidobacterium sp. UTCIF-37]|uniref:alpha/beta hydrolase n=1 Tax=unclassified Bifidobacterium TaxID=2608897 RepID=UPI001125F1DD|nr:MULTISPECIES: alpha/beta hydrolase-fold protein [unclassified Bifidobacterium]TPF86799.1 phospholipase [Bifidobacterium sp. UTCIF-37]TPF90189.1 phospholipase [Bifidobacterium sp. UTCIF-38]
MQLRMTSQINVPQAGSPFDDRLFVMFHGYGNDEREMIRIIDAVYADGSLGNDGGNGDDSPDVTGPHPSTAASTITATPSYLSFRGTYDRPYMGGAYWYPDGCGVEERRRACTAVGEALVPLLDNPLFADRSKVLVGFSQGGYLSYRLVLEHPDVFDAAILMSPSFKGEETARLDSPTRFLLTYGSEDHTIPLDDQRNARRVLQSAGHLTYREYVGMGHAICDEEIRDIRTFLTYVK